MAIQKDPVNPQEARWREAMEALGPDVIAAKLLGEGTGYGRGADVLSVVETRPHPSRGFIEDWLAERKRSAEKLERSRFRWVLWLAVAAALFSAIAAWPVVKPWVGLGSP